MLRAVTAGLLALLSGVTAAQQVSQRARTLRQWRTALENMRCYCICSRLQPEEIWRLSAGEAGLPPETEKAESEILLLTKEEKTLLSACLKTLFDGTQEQQTRQFEYACAFFEKRLAQAEEKHRQDAKLYATLGVFGGLCIFLVCL